MTDKISESLGLTPIEEFKNGEVLDAEEIEETDQNEDQSVADYDYVRDNIKDIIANGSDSLSVLAQLAEQAEHPRAFEVLAGFMKTMLEANKELVALDKMKHERFKNDPTSSTNNTTNNNYLVAGTTSDLKRLVDQMRQKDKEEND